MAIDILQSILTVVYVVIGAILGSVLTFLAERGVQTRAWKREYVMRNVERIYEPLYREVVAIPPAVRNYWYYPTPVNAIKTEVWDRLSSSELRLFIPDDLSTDLKKLYEVALPAFQEAYQKAYAAMLLAIRSYVLSFSGGPDSIDAGLLDQLLGQQFFDYYRVFFMEGWDGLRRSFKTETDMTKYVSNTTSTFTQNLKNTYKISLPENFLDEMKGRVDKLQELVSCRRIRDDLLALCEQMGARLEGNIRQPWKI